MLSTDAEFHSTLAAIMARFPLDDLSEDERTWQTIEWQATEAAKYARSKANRLRRLYTGSTREDR